MLKPKNLYARIHLCKQVGAFYIIGNSFLRKLQRSNACLKNTVFKKPNGMKRFIVFMLFIVQPGRDHKSEINVSAGD